MSPQTLLRLSFAAIVATTAVSLTALSQPVAAHEFKLADLVIEHPYSNATPPGAKNGAAYFGAIKNNGKQADRLVSATASVCASVEVHTMTMDNNVMRMREINGIDLPAGSATAFGHQSNMGYHLMLMNLKEPLKEGSSFKMTLKFEKAGEKEVTVSVQKMKEAMHKH